MSRTQVTLLATFGLLAGVGMLVYVLVYVPPYTSGEQLSPTALLLFFMGLFFLSAGFGALLALALHRRWPALAGRSPVRRVGQRPHADAAMRQGLLFGLMVAILAAMALLRVLDITFLIVTVLLVGLVEAYAQTRS